jgi:predicted DNA binding CopG/RHH family protein
MAKEQEFVKTSLRLPRDLWKAAHVRAMDEGTDLQTIISKALEAYLRKGGRR